MINAIFVVFVFILSSICSFSKGSPTSKIKRQLFLIISIIIVLGVIFRDGNTLNDYSNYISLYNSHTRSTEVETSFILIRNISRNLGGFFFLVLIYGLLGVITKLIAIRRLTELTFLTLVIYTSNIMILHDMTQIRAGVTSGIFLLSIPYLVNNQKSKYILCTLVATFFHFSGLLLFLPCLYWIKPLRNSKLFYWIIIPIGYLLGGTIFNIDNIPIESIRLKLVMYKNLQEIGSAGLKELNIFNPYILFRIALYYLILSKENLISPHNKYFKCILFIEALALFIFPALSSIAILGYRGSELIGVVEIILYPMLYYILRPKLAAKSCVIGIGGLLLGINLTYKHLIYL